MSFEDFGPSGGFEAGIQTFKDFKVAGLLLAESRQPGAES